MIPDPSLIAPVVLMLLADPGQREAITAGVAGVLTDRGYAHLSLTYADGTRVHAESPATIATFLVGLVEREFTQLVASTTDET